MSLESFTNGFQSNDDRLKEVKAFDATKMGVKGLIDSGVKCIPKIFIRPLDELSEDSKTPCVKLQVPTINLEGIDRKDRYNEIVKEVLDASETWGFFQVVNHGISVELLDEMLQRVRMFHEQNTEVKKEFYTRETLKQVVYNSNYDLYTSRSANWKDTLVVNAYYGHLDPKELPEICRYILLSVTYLNILLSNCSSKKIFCILNVNLTRSPNILFDIGGTCLRVCSIHLNSPYQGVLVLIFPYQNLLAFISTYFSESDKLALA